MIARISTLSTSLQLQRHGNGLRIQFETAGQELASGIKSNVLAATAGASRHLLFLDRAMARIDAQSSILSLAAGRTATTGKTLDLFRDSVDELGPRLLSAADRGDMNSARIEANEALNRFAGAIASLNVRHGGRSLFAGDASDTPATIGAAQILADLEILAAPAPDANALVAIVDDYFTSPGGGFDTNSYTGSQVDAPQVELAEGESVSVQYRADNPAFRAVLRDLALSGLVARGALNGSANEQRSVLQVAGRGLLTAQIDMLNLRANLGHTEQRIAEARDVQAAEKTGLEVARNNIVAADSYESATVFQALQGQLQSHYLVSARLSQMTLTSFLR